MPSPLIYLLTDIPDWNSPLIAALEKLGVEVRVMACPGSVPAGALLVNRVSAGVAATDPDFTREIELFLQEAADAGCPLINGAECFRFGYHKLAQSGLFAECGARTPATRMMKSGERALPDADVLLKPLAGGHGEGIVALKAGESLPPGLAAKDGLMIEQERIVPADGMVHRLELLDGHLLYEAATEVVTDTYDYCLASGSHRSSLQRTVQPTLARQAIAIAERAGMSIGSLEYLFADAHTACFIDLNPVSSFHSDVERMLGFDPVEKVARWLGNRARYVA